MWIKTNELTGNALDWAVAKCEGYELAKAVTLKDRHGVFFSNRDDCLRYTTNWSQGGPIIERERIAIDPHVNDDRFCAFNPKLSTQQLIGGGFFHGDTPLIAAMRCYVASKLGAEIEVPDELV